MIILPKILEYFDVCYNLYENSNTLYNSEYMHNNLNYAFVCNGLSTDRGVLLKSDTRTEYKFLIRLYKGDSTSFNNITATPHYNRIISRKNSDYVVVNNIRYNFNCTEEEVFQYQTIMTELEFLSYYICLKTKHYNCNYAFVIRDGFEYSALDKLIGIAKNVK